MTFNNIAKQMTGIVTDSLKYHVPLSLIGRDANLEGIHQTYSPQKVFAIKSPT